MVQKVFSATQAYFEILERGDIPKDYDFTTYSDPANNVISRYFLFDGQLFRLEEPATSIKWELKNEKKNIGNALCQLATINYKGRIWNAWFTTQYNISGGPYVFNCLPGLVVSLEDSTGHYRFNLVEIHKTNDRIAVPSSKINLTQLKKLQQAQFDDPYLSLKRMGILYGIDKMGNKEPAPDFNKMTKSKQAYMIKNNNPIELTEKVDFK